MRIATFQSEGQVAVGLVTADGTIVPVPQLVPEAPVDMLGIIDAGPALWNRLHLASESLSNGIPLASVTLLAPVPRPRRNVMCVGWNYSEHFAEGRGLRGGQDEPDALPEWPALFSKNPRTVVGPDAHVWHPAPLSDQLDWEAELAAVIGSGGRDIKPERALEHVFGYTVANDVSVRDVQRRHGGQWFKGKNFDTHLPMGPWIVTTDEIGDPQALRVRSSVNGVTKQDAPTSYMVFSVAHIISELSRGMELEAGDLIITGTPEGVGFARNPPEYLRIGDVMEMAVEGIGVLRNRVTARPSEQPRTMAADAEPSASALHRGGDVG